MAERKRLGDILKDAGLIDEFQLQSALSHQKNWKGKLGSILVELGFIRESELAKVLSEKLRIPRVNLFNPEIPEEMISLLKEDIAKKLSVIPVRLEGRVLTVAVSDPMDMEALDEVRFITGLAVKPALAMESEIKDAIKKYYDHEQIQHQEEKTIQEKLQAGPAEMQIMRDNPDMGKEAIAAAESFNVISSSSAHDQAPVRDILDSMVSLLIEKGLISREELVERIKQKKMGL